MAGGLSPAALAFVGSVATKSTSLKVRRSVIAWCVTRLEIRGSCLASRVEFRGTVPLPRDPLLCRRPRVLLYAFFLHAIWHSMCRMRYLLSLRFLQLRR